MSMKTINVTFDDKEHQSLEETKGDLSWHDFILKLLKKGGRKDGDTKIHKEE